MGLIEIVYLMENTKSQVSFLFTELTTITTSELREVSDSRTIVGASGASGRIRGQDGESVQIGKPRRGEVIKLKQIDQNTLTQDK